MGIGVGEQCANVIRKFVFLRIKCNGIRIIGNNIFLDADLIYRLIFDQPGVAFFALVLVRIDDLYSGSWSLCCFLCRTARR